MVNPSKSVQPPISFRDVPWEFRPATPRPGGLHKAAAVEGHHLPMRGVVPGRSRGSWAKNLGVLMDFSMDV